ncbi:MAG: acetylxylan esterase [Cyclobacteriaceae bacterium]
MSHSLAQDTNYDESKVSAYKLPDLLVANNGSQIQTNTAWKDIRRPELVALFEQEMYGKNPVTDLEVEYKTNQLDAQTLDGKAVVKEAVVTFSNSKGALSMNVLIFLPAKADGPAPLFLGMNFNGPHTVHPDPSISITKSYVGNSEKYGITDHKATARSRGASASRWAVEEILARGYGLATVYCGDIDPDFDDGFKNGIHQLTEPADQERPDHSWGSIATWAWGLSRALDYFEQDPAIDHEKVIVFGHSRLGKTALWAGAHDQRFALVISNDSGCGGAALSRRRFGEKVTNINGRFPHWFCKNFHRYNDKENELPVDQHMLLALMAPRPIYVASAVEDPWADPKGEYLSLYHASPVYKLFGMATLDSEAPPAVDTPASAGNLGYHIRSGKHDVTLYDWQQYLDFADEHLKK